MRDRPAGRAVMRQVWEQLGFLHWPVDAAALARLLPPGLDVDLFEGVAYVGIVPFTIPLTRAAAFGARIAPAFHEINVRTYVHRGGRDPGVWFFSLDATSLLAVAGARVAYRLPYFAADIAMEVTTDPGTGLLAVEVPLRPAPIARGVPRAVPAGRAGGRGRAGLARALPGRALPPVFVVGRRAADRARPPRAVPAATGRRRRRRADADVRGGPAAGGRARATRRWCTTPEASTSRSSAPALTTARGPIGQGPSKFAGVTQW